MNNILNKYSLKFRLGILLFLSALFFSLVWIFVLPVGDFGPDETSHLQMIEFLAKNKKVPVFDSEEDLSSLNFESQLWNDKFRTGAYYSMGYNSPLSYLPYLTVYQQATGQSRGNILFLRAINCLILASFSLVLFLFLLRLDDKNLRISASLAFFITFIPQIIFSASYVNIESIALLFSALSLYYLTGVQKNPLSIDSLFLGISLGLLSLCKVSYLALVGPIYLLAYILIWSSAKKVHDKIASSLFVVIPTLFLTAWWWIRNLSLYQDPLIINFIQDKIKATRPDWFLPPGEAGYNALTIIAQPDFFRNTFLGFFAALGRLDIFLPNLFYVGFYIIVMSLLFFSVYRAIIGLKKDGEKLYFGLVFAIVVLLVINFYLFTQKNLLDFSPQGRHLYPMLLPITWLLYNGIKVLGKKAKKFIAITLVFFATLSSFWALWLLIDRYWPAGLDITINRAALTITSLVFIVLFISQILLIGKNNGKEN